MKKRTEWDEQYWETMLHYAAEEFAAEQGKEAGEILAQSDKLPRVAPPPGFVREMERRAKRAEGKTLGSFARWQKIAACFVLVVGLGMGALAPNAQAFLQYFKYFVMQDHGTHTSMTLTDQQGDSVAQEAAAKGWDTFYMPSRLPEGLVLVDTEITQHRYALQFAGDGMTLLFHCTKADRQVIAGADTEDAKAEEVRVGRIQGTYISKDDQAEVHFHNDEVIFMLWGQNIPKAILLDIAESIEF